MFVSTVLWVVVDCCLYPIRYFPRKDSARLPISDAAYSWDDYCS